MDDKLVYFARFSATLVPKAHAPLFWSAPRGQFVSKLLFITALFMLICSECILLDAPSNFASA